MSWFNKKENNIDHPDLVLLRRNFLQKKLFLKKIYEEWYSLIIERLPESDNPILEIGSGAGFFKEFASGKKIITSEILKTSGVDLVFDACRGIPLKDNSLSAIVMTDVLHHLPDTKSFFSESTRLLTDGGKIIMIEPWVTVWSKLIFKNFHHEPFDDMVKQWEFKSNGPLSDANGALPWIIFKRDISMFSSLYPHLHFGEQKLLMPFVYLISGGFSYSNIFPVKCYSLIRNFEKYFEGSERIFPMFAVIQLTKK